MQDSTLCAYEEYVDIDREENQPLIFHFFLFFQLWIGFRVKQTEPRKSVKQMRLLEVVYETTYILQAIALIGMALKTK
jgi:hypothetical protein